MDISIVFTNRELATKANKLLKKFNENDGKRILYQLYSNIKTHSQEQLYQLLINNTVLWNLPIYDLARAKNNEFNDFLKNPIDVAEGVVVCKKCGSNKTWSVQKQTRSGDEPMTTFSTCVECRHSFVFNG